MSDREDYEPTNPYERGSEQKRDDLVGYRNPPKEHQFRKGQSGNPRGRPKGSKGLATMVREHLREKVQMRVDGKLRTLSVGQGILLRIFREGLAGKKAQTEQALRLMKLVGMEDEPAPETLDLTVLSDEELEELMRLQSKMMGEEARYHQERAQERERESPRTAGPGDQDHGTEFF